MDTVGNTDVFQNIKFDIRCIWVRLAGLKLNKNEITRDIQIHNCRHQMLDWPSRKMFEIVLVLEITSFCKKPSRFQVALFIFFKLKYHQHNGNL